MKKITMRTVNEKEFKDVLKKFKRSFLFVVYELDINEQLLHEIEKAHSQAVGMERSLYLAQYLGAEINVELIKFAQAIQLCSEKLAMIMRVECFQKYEDDLSWELHQARHYCDVALEHYKKLNGELERKQDEHC